MVARADHACRPARARRGRSVGGRSRVVGAGLAAAIEIARAGRSVLVVEAKEKSGGGAKTEQLTLPGFHHDVWPEELVLVIANLVPR